MKPFFFSIPKPHKLNIMVYACNSSPWREQAGGLRLKIILIDIVSSMGSFEYIKTLSQKKTKRGEKTKPKKKKERGASVKK